MCFGGGGGGQQSMVKDHIFTFFWDPSLRRLFRYQQTKDIYFSQFSSILGSPYCTLIMEKGDVLPWEAAG